MKKVLFFVIVLFATSKTSAQEIDLLQWLIAHSKDGKVARGFSDKNVIPGSRIPGTLYLTVSPIKTDKNGNVISETVPDWMTNTTISGYVLIDGVLTPVEATVISGPVRSDGWAAKLNTGEVRRLFQGEQVTYYYASPKLVTCYRRNVVVNGIPTETFTYEAAF